MKVWRNALLPKYLIFANSILPTVYVFLNEMGNKCRKRVIGENISSEWILSLLDHFDIDDEEGTEYSVNSSESKFILHKRTLTTSYTHDSSLTMQGQTFIV